MVIPAASRLKNVQWHTQTVLFGWASQGVWPPGVDGTEVIVENLFCGFENFLCGPCICSRSVPESLL